MDSIIKATASVAASYTIGLTLDVSGDTVTSIVSFLPRDGKKGTVRTVKVEGTVAEVEAALPGAIAKASELITTHDSSVADLEKQLEAERAEKSKGAKKATPAKSDKKDKGGKDDDASHSEGDGIEVIERKAPAPAAKPNPASQIEIPVAPPAAAAPADPSLLDL